MKRCLMLVCLLCVCAAFAGAGDILPTSQNGPQVWKYTFEKPSQDWNQPGFNDSGWKTGSGMFGKLRNVDTPIRTEWTTANIWLRRTFKLEQVPSAVTLRVLHDEDAEVYLNGVKAAAFTGPTKKYEEARLSAGAMAALKSVANTIAVHCRQTRGGQGIDVGLVAVAARKAKTFTKKVRSVAGKPNMVVFLADDHGRAECSVYGNKEVRTPMMASLAKDGMVFDAAFVASPACGPSRSALLSGLMPARNGAEANHMAPRPETQIMVKRLQQAGYEVVAFGKVAHGKFASLCGFDQDADARRDEIGRKVKQFLDHRTSNKPLCLMVGDHRPHVPWTKEMDYDPEKITLPSCFVDTPETREHWARYLTDITGMDAQMAEIDGMARAYFGNDDYLFLYTADHGGQWPFGKWNLYDKGINVPLIIRWPGKIKAGVRTDAMVSWIDIFPTLLDLVGGSYPADIDGKSFAPVLLGRTNKHRDVIYTTHSGDGIMNVYPIRSVRTRRWKYIRNLRPDCYHSNHSDILRKDGAGAYWDSWDAAAAKDPKAAAIVQKYYVRPAIEFYDIENDPAEQNNLADNPEYAAQLGKMSAMLDDWMKEQGDTQQTFNEPYPVTGPKPVDVVASKKPAGGKKKKGGRKKKK